MGLATRILNGDAPPAQALHQRDIYDELKDGKPFLGSSSKIALNENYSVFGTVLYMMPAMNSGREACAGRSPGCTASCLEKNTGRMDMSNAKRARRRRHACFYADRSRFLADLHEEIQAHVKAAKRKGLTPSVRLNGTTDLPWHKMKFTDKAGVKHANLHEASPDAQFYEYTKLPLKGEYPPNLHLTFSVSERSDADDRAATYLEAGYSAAVVMRIGKHEQPDTFRLGSVDYPVVDGDLHDARFLDPPGSIAALAAKGLAKKDASGFVRDSK